MRFIAKKSLGQNFLINQKILNLIVDLGEIKNTDSVLEVGPGTGNLTEKILNKNPKNLFIIEKDKRLISHLNNKFKKNINLYHEDILEFSYKNLINKKLIIYGNLPYNISTQILVSWIKLDKLSNFCKKFILLFQKEVADRIIAEENSKNYGRLSILCSWKMNVKKIIDIESENFRPSPKVKSSLLFFEPKKKYLNLKCSNLEHITNVFFNQRRKMIKKPLNILFKNSDEIVKQLNLNLKLRPQNLTKETYYKICEFYEKLIN